jgi:hypothetical protein
MPAITKRWCRLQAQATRAAEQCETRCLRKHGTYVPIGVKQDEAVAANEVQSAAAGLGGQQEHEFVPGLVVEQVHEFLREV